jgi:hypothetical protein
MQNNNALQNSSKLFPRNQSGIWQKPKTYTKPETKNTSDHNNNPETQSTSDQNNNNRTPRMDSVQPTVSTSPDKPTELLNASQPNEQLFPKDLPTLEALPVINDLPDLEHASIKDEKDGKQEMTQFDEHSRNNNNAPVSRPSVMQNNNALQNSSKLFLRNQSVIWQKPKPYTKLETKSTSDHNNNPETQNTSDQNNNNRTPRMSRSPGNK